MRAFTHPNLKSLQVFCVLSVLCIYRSTAQHRGPASHGPYNSYPVQNIFGNFLRPGAPPPFPPPPSANTPPGPHRPPVVVPNVASVNAPPPPGKRRPPSGPPQGPRPRSIGIRPGPPRPPGRNHRPHHQLPPPPPPPARPDVATPVLPNEVLSLTSNFGEEPGLETTTRQTIESSSVVATTEFDPSPAHAINFNFDNEKAVDVLSSQYPSVEEIDFSSNDLAQVAPFSEPLIETELPFKLTPRGHSAPVIISQVPVKSIESNNNVIKQPMPESRQETFFDGEDLSSSSSQVSEQLYEDESSQRVEAKADSSKFYFKSQPSSAQSRKDESHSTDRENRLLNHDHDHHSQHHNNQSGHVHNIISLTDESKENSVEKNEEVRELVDCGGRDLGFCDMSSKYPGHMMGNLMSDCQELVYRGFVPVPEDIDELGDSDPVAKYSNSSKSAVRAQTGSWSWKPYSFKKKPVCDSELRFIRPGYARDATGKWQVIVQTEHFPQRVAIDLCHSPEKPCRLMSDCGQKSKCVQRYNFQHLLAVDPDRLHDCPTIRAFKFPSACVCHIEYSDFF